MEDWTTHHGSISVTLNGYGSASAYDEYDSLRPAGERTYSVDSGAVGTLSHQGNGYYRTTIEGSNWTSMYTQVVADVFRYNRVIQVGDQPPFGPLPFPVTPVFSGTLTFAGNLAPGDAAQIGGYAALDGLSVSHSEYIDQAGPFSRSIPFSFTYTTIGPFFTIGMHMAQGIQLIHGSSLVNQTALGTDDPASSQSWVDFGVQIDALIIPEPPTWLLAGFGVAGILACRYLQNRSRLHRKVSPESGSLV
jgi:hypothetical protein